MILELVAAVLLGGLMVWLAIGRPSEAIIEPDVGTDAFEDTDQGRALLAIKELEFDKETGKIAEADYEVVRERLTREALATLGEQTRVAQELPAPTSGEAVPRCPSCGPRPELDARFCSACGTVIA